MKKLTLLYSPESSCCNTTVHILDKLASHMGFELEKLDLDKDFDLASELGILSTPALVYERKVVFSGDQTEEVITNMIDDLLSN